MATAAQIYASLNVSPDPDVVVALDAQFDRAGKHTSYLVATGVSTTLHVKFNPDGPAGKSLFDKPGVDLFLSNEPVPTLSGVYELWILREKHALLYQGNERVWSGESVKAFNNLAGVHEVKF